MTATTHVCNVCGLAMADDYVDRIDISRYVESWSVCSLVCFLTAAIRVQHMAFGQPPLPNRGPLGPGWGDA